MNKDKWRPSQKEVKESVTDTIRSAIPWLDSFKCPECNSHCEQTHTYSVDTAAFDKGATPAWECEQCDIRFYRDEDSGLTFDPFNL